MKRIRRNITATDSLNEIMFTIDDVVTLLTCIEELKEHEISVTGKDRDDLEFYVGDSIYSFSQMDC